VFAVNSFGVNRARDAEIETEFSVRRAVGQIAAKTSEIITAERTADLSLKSARWFQRLKINRSADGVRAVKRRPGTAQNLDA
jgi:hypothetical protein